MSFCDSLELGTVIIMPSLYLINLVQERKRSRAQLMDFIHKEQTDGGLILADGTKHLYLNWGAVYALYPSPLNLCDSFFLLTRKPSILAHSSTENHSTSDSNQSVTKGDWAVRFID